MIARFEEQEEVLPLLSFRIPLYEGMKRALQEKLFDLRTFNIASGSNYAIAMKLAANVMEGLSQIQNNTVFNQATGMFTTKESDMDWVDNLRSDERRVGKGGGG